MNRRLLNLEILGAAFIVAAWLGVNEARGDLAHRYSFNGDATDSVGGADGVVVDPTGVVASFGPLGPGQQGLTLANTGQMSDQGGTAFVDGAYVDLPNGIVSALGDVGTFETWVSVNENRDWAEIFSFGAPASGVEDEATGGGDFGYITLIPDTGNAADTLSVHHWGPGGPPLELNAPDGQVLSPGVEHHVVSVVDKNDTTAGADGTAYMYLNGQLVNSGALPENFSLGCITDVNNWLGRSQWNDPLFDGSYNEFRIYDDALSANDVATNAFFGPDVVDAGELLSLTVDKSDGGVSMTNNASVAVDIDFYRISSDASALDVDGWISLDDQNYDAVDGPDPGTVAGDSDGEGWDEAGGSDATQLVELFLAEAGSSIGPGQTLDLGAAYDTSVFGDADGDLAFEFGIVGGLRITGGVTFVGEAGGVPGDYNDDGVVDAADYAVWRDNLGKDVSLPNDPTPGAVTAADYDTWVSNYGQTSGAAQAAGSPAPEPSAWLLSALAAIAIGARRRVEPGAC